LSITQSNTRRPLDRRDRRVLALGKADELLAVVGQQALDDVHNRFKFTL